MPDTALPAPAMQEANGFLVVSSQTRLVLGRMRTFYEYDSCETLNDAADLFTDLENGEREGWHPVAILPCRNGIPLNAARLGTFTLARLVKETEAA